MEDNGLWPFGEKNSFHRSHSQAPPVVKSGDYSADSDFGVETARGVTRREWEQGGRVRRCAVRPLHHDIVSCVAYCVAHVPPSINEGEREGGRGRTKGSVNCQLRWMHATFTEMRMQPVATTLPCARERVLFLYHSK